MEAASSIEQNTRFSLNGVQVATLDFTQPSMFRVDPRLLSIRVRIASALSGGRISRSANFPVVHSVLFGSPWAVEELLEYKVSNL